MVCAACEIVLTPKELCPACKKIQTETEKEWQASRKEGKCLPR